MCNEQGDRFSTLGYERMIRLDVAAGVLTPPIKMKACLSSELPTVHGFLLGTVCS